MPALSCPECGTGCRVHTDQVGRNIRCPQCGARFTADPRLNPPTKGPRAPRPARWWAGVALLAVAVALAAPAAWAILSARGDVYQGLHGEPLRDLARYLLFGAIAAAVVGVLLLVRFARSYHGWPSDRGAGRVRRRG